MALEQEICSAAVGDSASLQHADDFLVDLTKEQIEAFPAYDEKELTSEEQWADYEQRYCMKWSRVRSCIVKPPTEISLRQQAAIRGRLGKRFRPPMTQRNWTWPMSRLLAPRDDGCFSHGPSLRWSAFEDTLRRRREEVLQSSIDTRRKRREKRCRTSGTPQSQLAEIT